MRVAIELTARVMETSSLKLTRGLRKLFDAVGSRDGLVWFALSWPSTPEAIDSREPRLPLAWAKVSQTGDTLALREGTDGLGAGHLEDGASQVLRKILAQADPEFAQIVRKVVGGTDIEPVRQGVDIAPFGNRVALLEVMGELTDRELRAEPCLAGCAAGLLEAGLANGLRVDGGPQRFNSTMAALSSLLLELAKGLGEPRYEELERYRGKMEAYLRSASWGGFEPTPAVREPPQGGGGESQTAVPAAVQVKIS